MGTKDLWKTTTTELATLSPLVHSSLRPYISIMKLRVVSLLVLVAVATAIAAAGPQTTIFSLLVLFVVGVLSAGGCGAINSFWDRDIDPIMRRTAARPIPLQLIRPEVKALYFGAASVGIALVLGTILLNTLTALFVLLGALIYIFVYTIWLKRRTSLSIIWGGFAGSCPVLAGWASTTGSITPLALLLALVVLVWIPGHNWTFAIRMRGDYERVGIPVLPTEIGNERTMLLSISSIIGVLAIVLIAHVLGYASLGFALVSLLVTLIVLISGFRAVRTPTPANAWRLYKILSLYLAVIFIAAAIEPFL
jgi:protoheme IX farnesyltransferase